MKIQNAVSVILLTFTTMTGANEQQQHHHQQFSLRGTTTSSAERVMLSDTFCWKDTQGRGVGTIPTACNIDNDVQLGALCYDPCPSVGYSRVGVDCHSDCPHGFENDGLYCRKTEYGRGTGYPWQFGDPLNSSNQFHRCEHDHGYGHCEQNGDFVYPKCKLGYDSFGCCICRPAHAPDCAALGLGEQLDLSCGKKIILGKPSIKTGCPHGKNNQAGLCYKPCDDGFDPVGPVCWSRAPDGWVDCGLGYAKTVQDCVSVTTTQITAVATLGFKLVLAAFGGELVDEAATVAQDIGDLLKFKKFLSALKIVMAQEKAIQTLVNSGNGPVTAQEIADAEGLTNPEDIIRFVTKVLALFDPTGISGAISAFSYPTCENNN